MSGNSFIRTFESYFVNLSEDYHVHSTYNDHSASELTIENVVKQAENLNLVTIAFTEHVRTTSSWIKEYLQEIDAISKNTAIKIIAGFEAKILADGSIDCPDFCAKNYFIVASFHTLYHKKDIWLNALHKVIKNPYVDVIGHLAPEPTFQIEAQEIEELGALMSKYGKVVEINAKYHRPAVNWINTFVQQEVRMHLGSDAHRLNEVGRFSNVMDLVSLVKERRI